MKQLKTIIKNVEISPAHGDFKESYKITYGESGLTKYCYNKEVFEFLDKLHDKEVVLQIETSKSGKDYIAGVEGLTLQKQEKKGFVGYGKKDMTDREIRSASVGHAILAGKSDINEIEEMAVKIAKFIKGV